jgi:hypothetical protein
MKCLILLIACLTVLAGCGKSDTGTEAKNTNDSSSPLTAPSDYLGALHKGQVAAEKVADTASITKAIQLFAIENGRNPKDLNELVEEKFLPAIPKPPYGMTYQYDANSGKVTVVKASSQP